MTTGRAKATPRIKSFADMGNWKDMNQLFGLGSAIKKTISEIEAISQGVFGAALDVIAQDISKARLRLVLVPEDGKGRRVVTWKEHPIAKALRLDPNDHMTWHEFNEMVIRSLALHQESFVVIARAGRDQQSPAYIPVHVSRVLVQVMDRKFFYDVTAASMGEAAILGFHYNRLSADDMIHMKGRMHTGERGLSTLVIGAGILNLNVALTTFQEGMAKNGLRPNAVIQTDANLSEEQFNRVKREIDEMLQNAVKGGKPALLEAGLKYEAIAMDAMKSDLNKARQLARHEAAALLRVPAYKVGASESEKYDNKAAAEQTYVDDCLIPIVGRAEAILCRALLTEKERLQGYALEFDRDDLYDRDRQQASTRIVEQFKSGVITRGQANLALGYDAVDDALDTYMIPVNSAVLKKDGTIDYVMPQKAGTPELTPEKHLRLAS